MPTFQKKFVRKIKFKNTVRRDCTNVRPESDVAGVLELSNGIFKPEINILRALIETVNNMQEEMDIVHREV